MTMQKGKRNTREEEEEEESNKRATTTFALYLELPCPTCGGSYWGAGKRGGGGGGGGDAPRRPLMLMLMMMMVTEILWRFCETIENKNTSVTFHLWNYPRPQSDSDEEVAVQEEVEDNVEFNSPIRISTTTTADKC